MAMRNFWVDTKIDGRETPLSGGPRAKDGHMVIDIYQRNNGESLNVFTIHCEPSLDGKTLNTYIVDENGTTVLERVTQR